MAKSGVFEGDPATVLKKEFQRRVKAIVDDDDINLEAIERAQQMLAALKEFKLKKTVSVKVVNQHSGAVPEEFKCPLSKELMRDPVIIASGQTYDRPLIQKWLKAGNRTCPQTQQVLSHTVLTPNLLIRGMIMQWCKNHGIDLPESIQYNEEDVLTEAEREQFNALMKKMSSTLSEQKEAATKLRLLTRRMPSFRAIFGESADAIPQLLSPLSQYSGEPNVHQELQLQEDIITTLLNVSIHDSNKKLVAETPMVIPILKDALRVGTIHTRTNAAAALFTLSALDSNKDLIGKSGALKHLIELLDEGHSLAMKDVASAIFNICIPQENKVRAISDGAVRVIMKKIIDRKYVDELLSILAMLSTNQKAIEEMVELDGVPCLLGIIREGSCARNKENCIAILYTICFRDRTKWKEVREEERMYNTISQLARNGTSRAQRKASGILERLNRAAHFTHSA